MPDLFAGTTFERAMPTEERRRWGRFYTAPLGVDLVLRLCLRQASDRVLDPSCGAGVFLSRAAALKQSLDSTRDAVTLGEELWGVEVDRDAAAKALQNLRAQGIAARIVRADFFSFDADDLPTFDCIVGNPPYTRQEWMQELAPGGNKSALIGRVLGQRSPLGGGATTLTRRAGLHAYFFVHAARFLREGGRLGFVASNSWLDVDYGAGLQAFFLNNFRILAIVESQVERWFTDASINTCLVILERCADVRVRDDHAARFVQLLRPLNAESISLADQAAHLLNGPSNDSICVRTIRQGDLRERQPVFGMTAGRTRRWGALLRAPQVYFDTLDRNRDRLVPLKSFVSIRRGFTSGANEFFYLDQAALAEWNIEPEFLRPLVKSPRDCAGRIVDPLHLTFQVFVVHRGKPLLLGTNALRYIEWGESRGFHTRPTCAARERWYDLGEKRPAHLAWFKGVWTRHFCPLLPETIALDQQLYGIELREPKLCKVVAALLNSTWTALCAELGGRVNFGDGILWLAAYEAGQLPLPDPARLTDAQAAALESTFDTLAARPVLPIFEEMAQSDRRASDEKVFDLMELDNATRQAIRAAVVKLVQARLTRAKSVERKE
jgi:methylase of polypeptide subunit release factors